MVWQALLARGIHEPIEDIEVQSKATGQLLRFPGSPTIRIDGLDIEPGAVDCDDCSPRCRLYETPRGLRGLPELAWLDAALDRALAS